MKEHVRLGQVRKAIKSEAMLSPLHLLACFGQKFERTGFGKNNHVPVNVIRSVPMFNQ
jgi:hypothetical protein